MTKFYQTLRIALCMLAATIFAVSGRADETEHIVPALQYHGPDFYQFWRSVPMNGYFLEYDEDNNEVFYFSIYQTLRPDHEFCFLIDNQYFYATYTPNITGPVTAAPSSGNFKYKGDLGKVLIEVKYNPSVTDARYRIVDFKLTYVGEPDDAIVLVDKDGNKSFESYTIPEGESFTDASQWTLTDKYLNLRDYKQMYIKAGGIYYGASAPDMAYANLPDAEENSYKTLQINGNPFSPDLPKGSIATFTYLPAEYKFLIETIDETPLNQPDGKFKVHADHFYPSNDWGGPVLEPVFLGNVNGKALYAYECEMDLIKDHGLGFKPGILNADGSFTQIGWKGKDNIDNTDWGDATSANGNISYTGNTGHAKIYFEYDGTVLSGSDKLKNFRITDLNRYPDYCFVVKYPDGHIEPLTYSYPETDPYDNPKSTETEYVDIYLKNCTAGEYGVYLMKAGKAYGLNGAIATSPITLTEDAAEFCTFTAHDKFTYKLAFYETYGSNINQLYFEEQEPVGPDFVYCGRTLKSPDNDQNVPLSSKYVVGTEQTYHYSGDVTVAPNTFFYFKKNENGTETQYFGNSNIVTNTLFMSESTRSGVNSYRGAPATLHIEFDYTVGNEEIKNIGISGGKEYASGYSIENGIGLHYPDGTARMFPWDYNTSDWSYADVTISDLPDGEYGYYIVKNSCVIFGAGEENAQYNELEDVFPTAPEGNEMHNIKDLVDFTAGQFLFTKQGDCKYKIQYWNHTAYNGKNAWNVTKLNELEADKPLLYHSGSTVGGAGAWIDTPFNSVINPEGTTCADGKFHQYSYSLTIPNYATYSEFGIKLTDNKGTQKGWFPSPTTNGERIYYTYYNGAYIEKITNLVSETSIAWGGPQGDVTITFDYDGNGDDAIYNLKIQGPEYAEGEEAPAEIAAYVKYTDAEGNEQLLEMPMTTTNDKLFTAQLPEDITGTIGVAFRYLTERGGPASADEAVNIITADKEDKSLSVVNKDVGDFFYTFTVNPDKLYTLQYYPRRYVNTNLSTRGVPYYSILENDPYLPPFSLAYNYRENETDKYHYTTEWADVPFNCRRIKDAEHPYHYEIEVPMNTLANFGIYSMNDNGTRNNFYGPGRTLRVDTYGENYDENYNEGNVNGTNPLLRDLPYGTYGGWYYYGVDNSKVKVSFETDGETNPTLRNIMITGEKMPEGSVYPSEISILIDSKNTGETLEIPLGLNNLTTYIKRINAILSGPCSIHIRNMLEMQGSHDEYPVEITANEGSHHLLQSNGASGCTFMADDAYSYAIAYKPNYRDQNAGVPVSTPAIQLIAEYMGMRGCPVLPKCVETDTPADWESISKERPAVYLMGEFINYFRPTPEYEMLPQGEPAADGTLKYRLNGIVLYSGDLKPGVKVFTSATDEPEVELLGKCKISMQQDDGSFAKPIAPADGTLWLLSGLYDAHPTPGAICDAEYTYNPNNPDACELVIYRRNDYRAYYNGSNETYASKHDDYWLPPFLSIVGDDIKQKETYDTPNALWNRQATTDDAWQEAWIQYDADGNILFDRQGRVMYNTCYPPRNQVFFTASRTRTNAEGTLEKIEMELNENNFTFEPQRDDNGIIVLSGAEWKERLSHEPNFEEHYANLFNDTPATLDPVNGGYLNTTKLQDDRLYVRYQVPNFWFLGPVKFFAGFTGGTYLTTVSKEVMIYDKPNIQQFSEMWSQWTNGQNFGFVDMNKIDDEGIEGYGLQPNYAYPCLANTSNFKVEEPTYFRNIELWYCVDDGITSYANGSSRNRAAAPRESSVFYSIPSEYNASVQATAYRNSAGRYKLDFDETLLEDVAGISAITVKRYSATESGLGYDHWVAVDNHNRTREECNALGLTFSETVLDNAYDTPLSINEFKEIFFSFSENTHDPIFASGKYFYGVDITFAKEGSALPEVITALKSNPFTIDLIDVPEKVEILQLVKNWDFQLSNTEYVTYDPVYRTAYGVATDAQKHVTVLTKLDAVPAANYYADSQRCQWTSLVLVRGDIGEFSPEIVDHYEITGLTDQVIIRNNDENHYDIINGSLAMIADASTTKHFVELTMYHTATPAVDDDNAPLPATPVYTEHINTIPSVGFSTLNVIVNSEAHMYDMPPFPSINHELTGLHVLDQDSFSQGAISPAHHTMALNYLLTQPALLNMQGKAINQYPYIQVSGPASFTGTLSTAFTPAPEDLPADYVQIYEAFQPAVSIVGIDPNDYIGSEANVLKVKTISYPDANPIFDLWESPQLNLDFSPRSIENLTTKYMYFYVDQSGEKVAQHFVMNGINYDHSENTYMSWQGNNECILTPDALAVVPANTAAEGARDFTHVWAMPEMGDDGKHVIERPLILATAEFDSWWANLHNTWFGTTENLGVKMSELYLFNNLDRLVTQHITIDQNGYAAPAYAPAAGATHATLSSPIAEYSNNSDRLLTDVALLPLEQLVSIAPGTITLRAAGLDIYTPAGLHLPSAQGANSVLPGIYIITAPGHAPLKIAVP